MSINRAMDKEDVIHIFRRCGTLLSHKKEWNNAICSNMDGPRDYHTKWNKSERKTNIIQYYLWWNLKDKTNEPIYNRNRLTNIENRLLFASGEVNGGGMDREFEISRYEVFYTQWINKVLLYSTENHIQYPQISHSEKEYKKECINIYMYNWITLPYSRH